MAEKQYRTVFGIVQFDPKDGEAAGKPIRNVVIRQVGFQQQAVKVYITIWPSHEDVEVARGDILIVEGSYTRGKGTDKDTGEEIVYHNISASKIGKLGSVSDGKRPETTSDDTDDAPADDDIPF